MSHFVRNIPGMGHQVIAKATKKIVATFDDKSEAEEHAAKLQSIAQNEKEAHGNRWGDGTGNKGGDVK